MKPIPNTDRFIHELDEIYNLFFCAFYFNVYGKEVYLSKIHHIDESIGKINSLLPEVKNEFWMNLEIDSFDFMIEFSRVKFRNTIARYNTIITDFNEHITNSLDLLIMDEQITHTEKEDIRNILAQKTWNISFVLEDLVNFFNELKASKYPLTKEENSDIELRQETEITHKGKIIKPKSNFAKNTTDQSLTLKSIIYENFYHDGKKYYTEKINKLKKFKQSQYGQLIDEFIKKNWVKPEFKNISYQQMSYIILNEFNVEVKPNTLNKSNQPKYNEFEDLKFQNPTTLTL